MASTSSTNPFDLGEPNWLTGIGNALDTFAAPSTEAAAAHPTTEMQNAGHDHGDAFERFESHEPTNRPAAVGAADIYDTVDTLKLSHREVEQYGSSLSRAVATAQLDSRFVSGDYLTKAFSGIGGLGLMPRQQRVRIHGETGLPTYSSWAQVSTVRDIARTAIGHDGRMKPFHVSTSMAAGVRELFVDIPDSPFGKTNIEVVDLVNGTAQRFRVHLDVWRDPGFIVRTTLHIDQSKASRFGVQPMRKSADGSWALNSELKAMLAPLANNGAAHLAFVASEHCGAALTSVTQGVIGPVWFDGTVKPDIIEDLFEVVPENMIACFTAFELHRSPGASTNPAWIDPDDHSLERLLAKGWSATVDKLWVCTPEIRSAIEIYANEYDSTLKVRPFY